MLPLHRFRWAYCQLQVLTQFKSTSPKLIKQALLNLPKTLDDTYSRMLELINEDDRSYALQCLRWIAYAHSPLSLDELTEANIIHPSDDPAADGTVETDNRGSWRDALDILAGAYGGSFGTASDDTKEDVSIEGD